MALRIFIASKLPYARVVLADELASLGHEVATIELQDLRDVAPRDLVLLDPAAIYSGPGMVADIVMQDIDEDGAPRPVISMQASLAEIALQISEIAAGKPGNRRRTPPMDRVAQGTVTRSVSPGLGEVFDPPSDSNKAVARLVRQLGRKKQ